MTTTAAAATITITFFTAGTRRTRAGITITTTFFQKCLLEFFTVSFSGLRVNR